MNHKRFQRFNDFVDGLLAIADAYKWRAVMEDLEKMLQNPGIIIQMYWRSLYKHMAASVQNGTIHPTFEMYFNEVWFDEI